MGELLHRCTRRQSKQHPEWAARAVIYELNIRQFSVAGDFAGISEQLPRLQQLGVDALWLMPIHPIGVEQRKGSLGSYYSIRDYRAVNPEFGTFDEFKELVQYIHNQGLKVILDWVPNHTSRDAIWTVEHPDWYLHDAATGEIAIPFDWTDTAQLNYANPEMRRGMVDAMRFWLTETGIDGFRVDMAMLEPLDFWESAVPDLADTLRSMDGRELFMLAEAEGPEFHRVAFDATYAWELHHLLVNIAQGRAGSAPAEVLRSKLMEQAVFYPPAACRLLFTSNHDENSWNGSEFQRLGAAARQMAVLTYLLSGIPLIYNGQEAGSIRQLSFFDKDVVDWSGVEGEYSSFYQELNHLRHNHPALGGGEQGGDLYAVGNSLSDKVFSAKRRVGDRVVLGLFNFSGDHADLSFEDEDFNGMYHQLGVAEVALLHSGAHFYLPPWGFFVYYK